MDKNSIYLVFLIIFLAGMPIGWASAAQYFVGVTIASGSAPGYTSESGATAPTDNFWCLPVYGNALVSDGKHPGFVKFYIKNNSGTALTAVSPTSNPTLLSYPACAGDTIWSGLFDLTSGTEYEIYFQLPDSYYNYCPGAHFDGHCFVSEYDNLDCCQTCSHYGLEEENTNANCSASSSYCVTGAFYYGTSYGTAGTVDSGVTNCVVESMLMGGNCSSCTQVSTFGYYNTSTRECYTTQKWTTSYSNGSYYGYSGSCAALPSDELVRVCACDIQSVYITPSFTFSFTPSF